MPESVQKSISESRAKTICASILISLWAEISNERGARKFTISSLIFHVQFSRTHRNHCTHYSKFSYRRSDSVPENEAHITVSHQSIPSVVTELETNRLALAAQS